MPISSVRDDDRRRLLTTVTGPVKVADILGHFDGARRGRTLGYTELIDARAAGRPFLSVADIRQAADLVRNTPVTEALGRRAVIVDDDVIYVLTRMFAALLADHFRIEVFRDRNEAEVWLAGPTPAMDAD